MKKSDIKYQVAKKMLDGGVSYLEKMYSEEQASYIRGLLVMADYMDIISNEEALEYNTRINNAIDKHSNKQEENK